MKEEAKERFFKLVGAKGTNKILEFLSEHDTAQYKDLIVFSSSPALNKRLRELVAFNLIEHHIERIGKRKEWYSITEKGRKAFECMSTLENLISKTL